MKHLTFIVLFTLLLSSCVGEDFLEDTIDPVVRITASTKNIEIDASHQFKAIYLNNIGEVENRNIVWSSSDESTLSIDENGLAIGLKAGDVEVIASFNDEGVIIEDKESVVVRQVGATPKEEENNESERTGNIVTTSSYILSGDFILSVSENNNDLILSFSENYQTSSSLPGLYVYLTNNPNSIANAHEIGAVKVFSGAHTYTLSNVAISEFSHVLYWCKPFGVKIGEGTIN